MALELLLDPLSGRIKLDDASNGQGTAVGRTILFSNYQLYGGWGFAGNKGMTRLGDRFEWGGKRWGVLACDRDSIFTTGTWAIASHPDTTGTMRFVAYQDQDDPWEAQSFLRVAFIWHVTFSWWELDNTINRGLIDTNFALDDGSVSRFNGVDPIDSRMTTVPEYGNASSYPGREIQLPAN